MTRDILLSITGMTPQVVTETLYAIYKQEPDRFPEEIYIITTKRGADKIRTTLLGDGGMLNRFCSEYGLPQIEFDESRHLKIICDKNGTLIDDARSKEDQQVIADFIFNEVRKLTQAKENGVPYYRIHASLAGGRKTMTYLLGSSMNILGNPEDRLSHVLVSEAFETCPEFFYPTKETHLIHGRNITGAAGGKQEVLDAAMAKVELSEIPLMFLQTLLDDKKTGKILSSYTNAVQEINNSLQLKRENLKLELSVQNYTLLINDKFEVQLYPREFFVYLMVARRIREGSRFIMPTKKSSFKSYIDAFELFFALEASFSFPTESYNRSYHSIVEKFSIKRGEICKLIQDKESEVYRTDPDLKAEDAEFQCSDHEQLEMLYKLAENINYYLQDPDNQTEKRKAFFPLNIDPQSGTRAYNPMFPLIKGRDNNGFYRLNKEFLNAQVEFWNNTIRDIGKKIKEKIGNPALAEYYCIKSDNKSGAGIKIIDLPAENIVIR